MVCLIKKASLISVLYVEHGTQFLNATYVSLPTFTVISPVTKCIRMTTKTWLNTLFFKFDVVVLAVFIFCCLTVYNITFVCSKFRFFITWIIQQIYNLLCFHFIWCLQIFVKIQKSFLLIFQLWKALLLCHR